MGCAEDAPGSVCSGRGLCVVPAPGADAVCVCDDGWTSAADFSYRPGQDCAVSVDALYALHMAALVVSCVAIVAQLWFGWRLHMSAVAASRAAIANARARGSGGGDHQSHSSGSALYGDDVGCCTRCCDRLTHLFKRLLHVLWLDRGYPVRRLPWLLGVETIKIVWLCVRVWTQHGMVAYGFTAGTVLWCVFHLYMSVMNIDAVQSFLVMFEHTAAFSAPLKADIATARKVNAWRFRNMVILKVVLSCLGLLYFVPAFREHQDTLALVVLQGLGVHTFLAIGTVALLLTVISDVLHNDLRRATELARRVARNQSPLSAAARTMMTTTTTTTTTTTATTSVVVVVAPAAHGSSVALPAATAAGGGGGAPATDGSGALLPVPPAAPASGSPSSPSPTAAANGGGGGGGGQQHPTWAKVADEHESPVQEAARRIGRASVTFRCYMFPLPLMLTLFAEWPYLRARAAYVVPLTFLLSSVVLSVVVFLLSSNALFAKRQQQPHRGNNGAAVQRSSSPQQQQHANPPAAMASPRPPGAAINGNGNGNGNGRATALPGHSANAAAAVSAVSTGAPPSAAQRPSQSGPAAAPAAAAAVAVAPPSPPPATAMTPP